MAKPFGITASIYRTKSFPGASNYFGKVDEVTVIGNGADGKPIRGVFEPTDKAPAVMLVFRQMGSTKLVHAVPVNPETGDKIVGPMAGGTFIHTSDSRFSEATGVYGAISLHDHFETAKQYRDNA